MLNTLYVCVLCNFIVITILHAVFRSEDWRVRGLLCVARNVCLTDGISHL